MIDSNGRTHAPASHPFPRGAPGRRQARRAAGQDPQRRARHVRGHGIGGGPAARLSRRPGWRTMPALETHRAIKDAAFSRRMRERLLPSTEVLVARLTEMSRERAQVEAQLEHYRAIVEQLQAKLRERRAIRVAAAIAAELLAWLDAAPRARRAGTKSAAAAGAGEVSEDHDRARTDQAERPRVLRRRQRQPARGGAARRASRSTTAAASAAAASARRGCSRARCRECATPTTCSPPPRRAPASCSCAAIPPSATS